jgi:hypothetical protein
MFRSTAKKWVFLVLAFSFWANMAHAQKPPKGGGSNPPAPAPALPGIIYHLRDQNLWAIRPDGTGLTQVLPSGFGGTPNFRPQGSNVFRDRWYLGTRETGKMYTNWKSPNGSIREEYPHFDVFAFRTSPNDPSQIESIQLTDLFGKALILGNSREPTWSLDDNDSVETSHIEIHVLNISDAFISNPDGTNYFDATGKRWEILRLPLTATEVTLNWASGTHQPFRPTDPIELAATLYPRVEGYWDHPVLTPDGQYLVALETGVITLLDPLTGNPLFVSWDGSSMGTPTRTSGMWQNNQAAISPDSTRIAVLNWGRNSDGGVWVISLDGSTPPKQLSQNSSKGNSYTEFEQVMWSPDSNYVLAQKHSWNTSTGHVWDQLILPASGGPAVVTFPKSAMWGIRWVASN